MTLNSLTPDISWIVPWSVLQQLCHLWRRFGIISNQIDRVYLSGEQLRAVGFPLEYEVFQLIIEVEFVALLWAKPCDATEHEQPSENGQYQVFMLFEPQAIAPLIQELTQSQLNLPLLTTLRQKILPQRSAIPPKMMLALLEIVRSPDIHDVAAPETDPSSQAINLLLSERLEQEKILNNVTHRIYQNQDLMVTMRLTLEQCQNLLKVDRLLIYQLDLPTDNANILVDRITFEVLSSPKIPSLLHFDEDDCLAANTLIKQAYIGGRHLVINDIVTDPNLSNCFKEQLKGMKVKAKIVVPLIVEEKLWGLLIAHQCQSTRRWRNNEITFLTHVAEYLAIAILQARSYQKIQAQKNTLETLAHQRAKELEDALLSAKVASQSKQEFIHIMSHELLTPLTSIIGLSNTLNYWSSGENANKLPPEKQRTYLQTIHESGLRLRNLLQDILDFSQTEAARSVLDLQHFSLKQLCYMLLGIFQEMSSRQGITLKFINHLEPEQDEFYADPVRLEKILTHLLSNAIKFTSHGGEVTFTIWRENQKDVLFQVKDTGIGIPPQQIPLLFQTFQQLEPSMSRSYEGAGFGLALVKQLVEIHQGRINVTSTPKKGSIFTVRIPCQAKTNLHPISKGTIGGNQGGTIVLVSQDEEMATLICELLTATNYQVIWLIDSAIAIRQVTILQPILVMLDGQQSKIPVEEMLQSLQASPQTQKIPSLLIGDRLETKRWQKLQKYGCQDYLQKPIESEELINLVNHHVTHYYATVASAAASG